jgi:hypothetical protein
MDALVASKEKVSLRLATLLLLSKKEVSFSELEALPTVRDRSDVEEIIEFLTSNFDAEKITKKTASWPLLSWDTIIKLRDTK